MIDFHCHIGRIESEMLNKKYGIPWQAGAKFLISTLGRFKEIDSMFATPYASPHVGYGDSLNWLLSEVAPYPELIPIPIIHPVSEITNTFLERINATEIPGIKLHCGSTDFRYSLEDTSLLGPLFSFAEENELIVFIHTDTHSCLASDLTPLLEDYTGRAVLLHCCRKEGVELCRHPSVFLETSGCNSEDVDYAMRNAPDRVIFGSDFPFFDYDFSLRNVKKHISQIEQNERLLLQGNSCANPN